MADAQLQVAIRTNNLDSVRDILIANPSIRDPTGVTVRMCMRNRGPNTIPMLRLLLDNPNILTDPSSIFTTIDRYSLEWEDHIGPKDMHETAVAILVNKRLTPEVEEQLSARSRAAILDLRNRHARAIAVEEYGLRGAARSLEQHARTKHHRGQTETGELVDLIGEFVRPRVTPIVCSTCGKLIRGTHVHEGQESPGV